MRPDTRLGRAALTAVVAVLAVASSPAASEDWPMQRHDMYGTGKSAETLKGPMALIWEYHTALAAEPVKPRLPRPKVPFEFDEFLPRIIAAAGKVFAGMPDHRIVCLDAATGKRMWSYMTDGPISQSPAYWDGHVYAGSDDGYVRCLNAETGKLIWARRAVDDDRQMLGWLKMQSTWAITSAVIVDGGKLFFTAGVFPHDGTFLVCLDAKTGRTVWINGARAERYHNSFAPTGIRVTKDRICVLTGIAAPAVFGRNGRYLHTLGRNNLWMKGVTLSIANMGTDKEVSEVGRAPKAEGPVTNIYVAAQWQTAGVTAANAQISGNAITIDGQAQTFELKGGGADYAVASGRIFIATRSGHVYGFATQGAKTVGVVAEPASKNPFAGSKHKAAVVAAAETALKQMIVQDGGFACVTDAVTGELAFELARKRHLRVYVVCSDPDVAQRLRETFLSTGFYGTRLVVRCGPEGKTNLVPYFADLVISEKTVLDGALPAHPVEMYRLAKPHRGTILVGGGAVNLDALKTWAAATTFTKDANAPKPALLDGGKWARLVRPILPGAGAWQTKYGDPGNTLCSQDSALKPPLGVQWYGSPAKYEMTDRHGQTIPPMLSGGVFISTYTNRGKKKSGYKAFDAYTGRYLWTFDTRIREHAPVVGTNICTNNRYAFIHRMWSIHQRDLWTGKEVREIKVGGLTTMMADEKRLYAVIGNSNTGNAITTYDLATGKQLWTYKGASIHANCTAVGDGMVFCIPGGLDKKYHAEAIETLRQYYKQSGQKEELADLEKTASGRVIWLLVALDAATGKPKWSRAIDCTHCGDGRSFMSRTRGFPIVQYRNGIVIHTESWHAGKLWGGFMLGKTAKRQACAHRASDGALLWRRTTGHRATPIIAGDNFYPEPFGLDLKTGKDLMRTHPTTGQPNRWIYCRFHKACGIASASTYFIVGRGESTAYYDLINDIGIQKFHAMRPACWLNVVSGDGLMIQPPYSQGCTCKYPFLHKPTFALRTVDRPNTSTGLFADGKGTPITPVKHLYMNLGSNGDMRDKDRNLWLGTWVRPNMSLFINNPLNQRWIQQSGGTATFRSTMLTPIRNTDVPFAFANGIVGKKIALSARLLGEGDGKAAYTVKLGFCDPDNDQPGQRVFDVKLNGKTVLTDFDIVKAAGGRDTATWKTFKNIEVANNLLIELEQKSPGSDPSTLPMIQCFVALRE